MTDWMDDAAKVASGNEDRERREHEKRMADVSTLRAEGRDWWNDVKRQLREYIDRFKDTYRDLGPIDYTNDELRYFGVAIGRMGTPSYTFDVDFDRRVLESTVEQPISGRTVELPPRSLALAVDSSGRINVLSENNVPLSIDALAQRLLGPVFRSIRKISD